MNVTTSADDTALVSPDRVRAVMQAVLRMAQGDGWTDEALGASAGMKPRRIKCYRTEDKEPSVSAMLSIGCVLGPKALNPILSLIGYVARPLEEGDTMNPMAIAAMGMSQLAIIAQAASDGRIDHIEEKPVTQAADLLIATILPLSSHAKAV